MEAERLFMRTPPSLLMRLRQPAEHSAWSEFVRLYTPLLYFWARRLGLQGTDADDLVQEAFLTLLRKLPAFTYDPSKSFRGWLRKLLLNVWRAGKRRAGPDPVTALDWKEPMAVDTTCALEESEYRKYVVGQALHIMQTQFEPTTWRACWEYAVRGRPALEVAAELGVSVAVVYSAKCRILRRLRRDLEGLLD